MLQSTGSWRAGRDLVTEQQEMVQFTVRSVATFTSLPCCCYGENI